MRERERLEVGNNTVEADGEFADGYCNGSLYYYDASIVIPESAKVTETLPVITLQGV